MLTATASREGRLHYDAFLSYARADAESFAERLYQRLSEDGFRIWRDREDMGSRGQTLHQEVRDRIHESERVLAVVTPAALTSEYVRVEWEYAHVFANAVVPIARDADPKTLPPELRSFHACDFRDEARYEQSVAELERLLTEPVKPLGPLRTTPPALPTYFLPRGVWHERIRGTVLADIERPEPLARAERITALVGMPGAGKSVLAAAFARAPDTRRAFSRDGVIWISVGQNPPASLVSNVLSHAFGVDLGVDEKLAATRLTPILANRACLIVLDDVWNVNDVEHVVSSVDVPARLLITTRDQSVATSFAGRMLRMDMLDDGEALRLLAAYSRHTGDLPAEAAAVAAACGNLPFALALCGTMVSANRTWSDVLHALKNADLTKIRAALPYYPYSDVLRAQEASVATLTDAEAERYRDLVVFPVDRAVPESAIETLWSAAGLTGFDTREILAVLDQKTLIQLTGSTPDRVVSMHDLQHDYLSAVVGDARQRHSRLLDSYAKQTTNGQWHTLRPDEYIQSHLTWHMEQAGRGDEIHSLLREMTPAGKNGWFEALSDAGALNVYVADVRRAWHAAKEQNVSALETDEPAELLAGEVRAALALSSATSRAEQFPAPLLAACVEFDVMRWQQAASIAALRLEPTQRARAWAALARLAPPRSSAQVMKSAVDAAREIQSGRDQLGVLSEMVRRCTVPPAIAADILGICAMMGGYPSATTLALLAPMLPAELFDDARQIAKAFQYQWSRAVALPPLLQRLPDDERGHDLAELVADIEAMPLDYRKVQALCAVAPLREEAVASALALTEVIVGRDDLASIDNNGLAFEALAHVQLSAQQWTELLRILETAHLNIENDVRALCALGPRLGEDERRRFVARFVEALANSKYSFLNPPWVAALLSFYLPATDRIAAIQANLDDLVATAGEPIDPMAWKEYWQKQHALQLLAELPDALLDRAVDAATQLDDDWGRAEVLAELLPRCSPARRIGILETERRRLERIDDAPDQAKAIAAFVHYLDEPDRQVAAREAYALNQTSDGAAVISLALAVELLPYLGEARDATVGTLLANVKKWEHRRSKDRGLAVLATAMPAREAEDALEEAERLTAEGEYQALAALIGRVPDAARTARIQAVLDEAERIAGELPSDFVKAIRHLAPFLGQDDITRVLSIADSIREPERSAAREVISPVAASDAGREPPTTPVDQLREVQQLLENGLGLRVAGQMFSTKFMKHQPRSFLFSQIASAAPVVVSIGRQGTAAEIVNAIRDTARWWP